MHHLFRPAKTSPDGRPIYAALDLGTNNCRLIIAEKSSGRHARKLITPQPYRVVDAFSRIVRLGEGLASAGRLSNEAMDRTIAALAICARKMGKRGVTHPMCITTEACRRAENCDEFLSAVRSETGLQLRLISGDEEARLGLIGCTSLLDIKKKHALIFDIGGGSTEISWLKLGQNEQFEILATLSIPFGVVTLTERFGGQFDESLEDGGHLSQVAYQTIVEEVLARLDEFDEAHSIKQAVDQGGVQMIGTSGTVTTLVGIHLRMKRYDRARVDGTYMSFDQIGNLTGQLAKLSNSGRAENACIGRHRADLVMPGCAILEAICAQWPLGQLRIADRGLREGMLFRLMNESSANTKSQKSNRNKKRRNRSRRKSGGANHATAQATQ